MKIYPIVVNDENARTAILAVGGSIDRKSREVVIPDSQVASREVGVEQSASPGGKYWNNHNRIVLSTGVKLLEEHGEMGDYLEIDRWS